VRVATEGEVETPHSPLVPTMITLPPADVIVVTALKPLEPGTRRKVSRVKEKTRTYEMIS
jgi:hypothetical protein